VVKKLYKGFALKEYKTITMDLLKAFNIADENVQINIRGTPNKPLFQANQIGTMLGIAKIHNTIRDFDEDEKDTHTVGTLGGPQNVTFLTEMGLYRLLGMSRKPIARTFQKWVCNVLIEIRENGKYELQQQNEIDRKLSKQQERLAIHNKLFSAFDKKKVVYTCWLEDLDEEFSVIKIGHTDELSSRVPNIITNLGNCKLIDVFEVDYNKKCERKTHDDPRIFQFKYKDIINNKNTSTETYKVNNEIYKEVLKVIHEKKEYYSKIDYVEILEIEKIKLKRKELEFEIAKTKSVVISDEGSSSNNIEENMSVIIDDSSSDSDSDISVEHMIKTRKQTRSPRIQQYEPIPKSNEFRLIKTYESIIDVIRDNEEFSKGGLKPACINNTLYKGFRWFSLDRQKDIKEYKIPPTTDIREVSRELVAMLNIDKNKIVQVFPSIKDASEARHFRSLAAICKAIKNGSQSSGHYWIRYNDCVEKLKVEYEKDNILPEKPPKVNGVRVQQISMEKDRKVIKEYTSISDVTTKFQMSRTSLKNANKNNTPHNGYFWKIIK
jgi:prophage antirepressor-like protein